MCKQKHSVEYEIISYSYAWNVGEVASYTAMCLKQLAILQAFEVARNHEIAIFT